TLQNVKGDYPVQTVNETHTAPSFLCVPDHLYTCHPIAEWSHAIHPPPIKHRGANNQIKSVAQAQHHVQINNANNFQYLSNNRVPQSFQYQTAFFEINVGLLPIDDLFLVL